MKFLTTDRKNAITSDWLTLFPSMVKFKSMLLRRIVGPFTQDILLMRSSSNDEYLPILLITNLLNPDSESSLVLGQRLTSKNGSTRYISVRWHENNYQEAAQKIIETALLPIEGNFTVDRLHKAANIYDKVNNFGRFESPREYECVVLSYAWVGKITESENTLKHYYNLMKSNAYRPSNDPDSLEKWQADVHARIKSPDELRGIVESEIKRRKLHKLPVSELMP